MFQVEEISFTAANPYKDAVYKAMCRYLDVGFAADFTFHGTKENKEFKNTKLTKKLNVSVNCPMKICCIIFSFLFHRWFIGGMKLWAEKNKLSHTSNRALRVGMWLKNIKDKRIQSRSAQKRTAEEAFE